MITAQNGQQMTEFQGKDRKVEIKCAEGHIFTTSAGHLYDGAWCTTSPSSKIRHACKKFQEILKAKEGTLISQYVNSHKHVTIRCKVGHQFSSIPVSICSRTWCKKCSNKCSEEAKKRFIATVMEMGGTLRGEYTKTHEKVALTCYYGHDFEIAPSHAAWDKWCPVCRGHCPKAAREKFEALVSSKGGIITSEYVNTATKVNITCGKNHEFSIKPNNATHGKWCRKCGNSESKGEEPIRLHLASINIVYQQEVLFPWSNKKRFDFSFNYKGNQCLIEFDGIQHFHFNPFFRRQRKSLSIDSISAFGKQQMLSKKVIKYCVYHTLISIMFK